MADGIDGGSGEVERTVAWVRHEGRSIAYQAIGSGPVDVLLLDEWFSHLDLDWDDPFRARWLRRIAASARLIRFDKSGMGLSDREPPPPDRALEVWADEAVAVLDALGVGVARLLVASWSGPVGVVLASRHAERFDRVAFATAFARLRGTGDPVAVDPAIVDAGREIILGQWGSGVLTAVLGQSSDDLPAHQRALDRRYERSTVAPRDLRPIVDALVQADTAACLPTITADTLVVHRPNPLLPPEHSRHLAAVIPHARFEEVEDEDWRYRVAEDEMFVDQMAGLEFLTGSSLEPDQHHRLLTIVFVDIVGSTARLSAVGDREWSDALAEFTAAMHLNLAHHRGTVGGFSGDGFLLLFESASSAMRFALATSTQATVAGLPMRTGVHTGECVLRHGQVHGLAVHAAARIMGLAGTGEVFASEVVRQLLRTDPLDFASIGTHELRGVPDRWELYSVRERSVIPRSER